MIRIRLARVVHRLRTQEGFALIYVLGAMTIVLGMSGAAVAAVSLDTGGTTVDTNQKQAYAAAQAGIQRYLFELNVNSTYWTQCGAGTNWIVNTGATGTPQAVPGSSTETYLVMLLPASGQTVYKQCSTANPSGSMITSTGSDAGTLRITSTGYAGGAKRTIVAAIRQQSFLNYAYFTYYETSDPVVQVGDAYASTQDPTIEPPDQCAAQGTQGYNANCGSQYNCALAGTGTGCTSPGATAQCSQYRSAGRENQPFYKPLGAYCTDIEFVASDAVNGPFHSNDSVLICGSPSFGRLNLDDSVEFGGDGTYPKGWLEAGGCSGSPTVHGTLTTQRHQLNMPSIAKLSKIASTSYSGTTCINLPVGSSQIQVAQPTAGQSCLTLPSTAYTSIAYPSNGVLYVNGSTTQQCNYIYDVDDPVYTVNSNNVGCGTVFVQGTPSKSLTIGADQDVVIDGNITYPAPNTNGVQLGLIAQGFIRVAHPVTGGVCTGNGASNLNGFSPITQIDAAMLSIAHSFIVDNYSCGASLGTLNVYGAIAQNFRGTVGTGGGGGNSTGYLKNYVYDQSLEYSEPPHFLAPTNAAYEIVHQTECDVYSVAAGGCESTS